MSSVTSAPDLIALPAVLGRAEDADVHIIDRWVSRKHCAIEQREDGYFLRDLSAKHGTFVNGSRVSESKVCDGDEIMIGLTRIKVRCGDGQFWLEPTSGAVRVEGLV